MKNPSMALFDIGEVIRGKRLGVGAFSHVNEIAAFVPSEDRNEFHLSMESHETRKVFAANAKKENGVPRFAIKTIQPIMMNDEHDFRMAAGALADEADTLSKLNHPNIIKVRGFPMDGVRAYVRTERYDGYFLILDRLEETLADRMETWKLEAKRLKNPLNGLWKQPSRRRQLLLERLKVARDIASALAYVHSQRIIYRDLKNDNVGFDANGEVKIFDFGLSRSLPSGEGNLNGSFQMSGKVGTIIFMAPEVYERKPYNTKADVYSFAMLLWEIMALQRPFRHYDRKMYKVRVVKRGERPPIDSSWPIEINNLLRRAWSSDMNARPSMQEVWEILETEIEQMQWDMGKSGGKQFAPNFIVPSAA